MSLRDADDAIGLCDEELVAPVESAGADKYVAIRFALHKRRASLLLTQGHREQALAFIERAALYEEQLRGPEAVAVAESVAA